MQVELGIVVHTCCASSCKGKTGEVSVSVKKKEKNLEFEADKMAQQVKALAAKSDPSQGENQVLKVVL